MDWKQEAERELQLLGWVAPKLAADESLCRFLFQPNFDPISQLSFRLGDAAEAEFVLRARSGLNPEFLGDILPLTPDQQSQVTALAAHIAGLEDCDLASRDGIRIQCELYQAAARHQVLITSPTPQDCPHHHALLSQAIALAQQLFPAFEAYFIRLAQSL